MLCVEESVFLGKILQVFLPCHVALINWKTISDCKSVLLNGKQHNLSLITGNNALPEDIPLSSLLVISLYPKGLYLWLEIMQPQIIFLFIKVQSTFERIWTTCSSYSLWQGDTSSQLSKAKLLLYMMDCLWQGSRAEGQKERRKTAEVCNTSLTCSLIA